MKNYILVNPDEVRAFVEAHFRVVTRGGSEWDVLCPVHGDSNASMRINVDKGVGFCHGCGAKGGMAKLARMVGTRWSTNSAETRMTTLFAKLDKLKRGPEVVQTRFFPEDMLARYRCPTPYWTDPAPHGRGYTKETVEAFDLGYDPINECAIIPIRDVHNRLMGVTRRFLGKDAGKKRYRDPKGFQKANNLFGSWFVAEHESATVALVEGPTDCMKVWQAEFPAVAQFGSHLTLNQVRILRALGIVKVVLFYDNDKAGRKATKQALGGVWDAELQRWDYDPEVDLRTHFLVSRVVYTRTSPKDPGAMLDQDIRQAIQNSQRVL